ncbi:type II toxin-antitoxin system RelE/ParE family toxin [Anabaena sp. UHCC 0187]|uniref:type II toxin-antitoxin system RelE/ParE family toxin n=1 Tax=Anabaena sp. UHCC 0187 TaxID=2590018 RepID=UPI0014468499|nr:type II toxin-antitoxin system RelE/ParE family toxin [Anabaena sp. UHCC 0187]MTJ14419.1 type II toxin-antitoxin system RelE/ParE family toxin [Anabaena sp. UHCC 0187]
MAFQVIVRNRATQDIRQQANYILVNGNRESGEKFLEFVEYAFTQLAITPNMGKVVSSLSDMGTIRQWRIKNFKDYLIFYKVKKEQVEVLRVLHGARDLEDLLPFLDEEV